MIQDPDYARWFTKARCVCWANGYALVVHGSMTRDLDVIAIPWQPQVTKPYALLISVTDATRTLFQSPMVEREHGRMAWTVRFPDSADPRWIDFSVIPPMQPKNETL